MRTVEWEGDVRVKAVRLKKAARKIQFKILDTGCWFLDTGKNWARCAPAELQRDKLCPYE